MIRLAIRALTAVIAILKPLIVGAAVIDYVVADENEDIRRVWEAMHDETQPIPIIR